MKFIENLVNRIFLHWQSSLIGIGYGVILLGIFTKHITVAEALMLLTAILSFKGIFINKDPDKTLTKPTVKENEIQIDKEK
jgi:hypothetical protein